MNLEKYKKLLDKETDFIDRYVNDISVELLVDKYRISRNVIYKMLKSGLDVFEN
ncbi:hypothetical protein [Clostridium paraputrificum]|uniref:hypothetical protein n=1 Tax=Clostridium paraputrificum TaxID=29363 RepID=UPI0004076FE6|nr:hypothetical protein [Clostridium paraputrificum]